MGRQRDPIPPPHAFHCVVHGKPRSVAVGRDERKAAHYQKWRDHVSSQVALEIARTSVGRGFQVIDDLVSVQLVWYSPDVNSQSDPDVDNVVKPYLDALKGEGRIISDDRRVRDLRIRKVDVNFDLQDLPGVLEAKNAPEFDVFGGEFVLLMVKRLDDSDAESTSEELRS